jgi:hypothetical protein
MTLTPVEQYAADLHQEVLLKAGDDASPTLREEAFTEHVLEVLSDHNDAEGAELCSFEARGSSKSPAAKLNAWALSGDGATLDLFVTRYFGTGKHEQVSKPDARRHFELVAAFLRRALDGSHTRMEESSVAFEAARRIHEARESLASVRLFLLSDGVMRTPEAPDMAFDNIDVQPVVWDLEKLSNLRVGSRSVIELDFANDYDGPIPCIQIADAIGEYRTFLAFMTAPLLARIYGEHGQRLLERNVRAFLQAKGKVNQGLQRTLREQPSRFLAYNNGLCCTAAKVDVDVDADRGGSVRLNSVTDFQIVNGGQTTASIFHALKKEKIDVAHVVVQVKLTVISDPSRVSEMVPLISRYANSQNKVNTADFSANGPFHQRIQELSRNTWAPAPSGVDRQTHWYYERARGSYADDRSAHTKAGRREWERQNPPQQKFTKTDLAKFELSWMGSSHLVCMGAEKAFLKHAEWLDEEGAPAVVDPAYFRHLVAKAILFRTAEKVFSKQELSGFRAQSVAYAVGWLAESSERRLDLDWIWDHQRVSLALCDALAIVCRAAHKHITEQQGNPGEASKREPCWASFLKTMLQTGKEWRAELAKTPFVTPTSEDEALASQWEAVRRSFLSDERTIADIEVVTGKQWLARRRKDHVSVYAGATWAELKTRQGLGPVKRRGLLELLAAAAGDI